MTRLLENFRVPANLPRPHSQSQTRLAYRSCETNLSVKQLLHHILLEVAGLGNLHLDECDDLRVHVEKDCSEGCLFFRFRNDSP